MNRRVVAYVCAERYTTLFGFKIAQYRWAFRFRLKAFEEIYARARSGEVFAVF